VPYDKVAGRPTAAQRLARAIALPRTCVRLSHACRANAHTCPPLHYHHAQHLTRYRLLRRLSGGKGFTSYRNDQRPPEACKRYDQPSQPPPRVLREVGAAFAGFRRIQRIYITTYCTRLAALSGLCSGIANHHLSFERSHATNQPTFAASSMV
jgi:hypothetical protein